MATATVTTPRLSLTVSDLAKRINGSLRGPGDVVIAGLNSLSDAGPGDITFITDVAYAKQWPQSKAAAAIVSKGLEVADSGGLDVRPLITVPNAEYAMIALLEIFQTPENAPEVGVHPSAVVHESVKLGRQVRIGPHVSIDAGCILGDGVVLHSGVRLYGDVQLGAGTVLHSNVVIRQRCRIGRGVILHQNVSIGADGFGYRPDPSGAGLIKIPHVGNVIIEDGVEIGANTCVDRGKFGSTVIGVGTKIDNLVQIAHNCRIGRCCVIAGCAGMSGSVVVGDGVQIGGAVGITDHLTIGSGARIGAMAFVMQDVPPGKVILGHPADDARAVLRQWISARKLPDLLRKLSRQAQADKR